MLSFEAIVSRSNFTQEITLYLAGTEKSNSAELENEIVSFGFNSFFKNKLSLNTTLLLILTPYIALVPIGMFKSQEPLTALNVMDSFLPKSQDELKHHCQCQCLNLHLR